MAITCGLAVAAAISGGAIAIASSDSEGGATGPQAHRAVQAALDATGGGTANAVERDDEDGATWEVEVTKPDGRTVDVRLDENYEVVMIEGDSESSDQGDGSE
jgi:peptidase YpeB-like protein